MREMFTRNVNVQRVRASCEARLCSGYPRTPTSSKITKCQLRTTCKVLRFILTPRCVIVEERREKGKPQTQNTNPNPETEKKRRRKREEKRGSSQTCPSTAYHAQSKDSPRTPVTPALDFALRVHVAKARRAGVGPRLHYNALLKTTRRPAT